MCDLQPIETAPRDGSQIILFQDGHYDLGRWEEKIYEAHTMVRQNGKQEVWEWVPKDESNWDNAAYEVYDPTHWAPLPTLPPTVTR